VLHGFYSQGHDNKSLFICRCSILSNSSTLEITTSMCNDASMLRTGGPKAG